MAYIDTAQLKENLMRERRIGRTSLEAILDVIRTQSEGTNPPLTEEDMRNLIEEPVWDKRRQAWGIVAGVYQLTNNPIMVYFTDGSVYKFERNRFYRQKVM